MGLWAAASVHGTVPADQTGETWRYRDVVKLIDDRAAEGKPFTSVDDLLDAFPPGLRRHFTLVFKTGSKLQDASPLHPRALAFGKYLVYAFNGHPDQKGYDSLELMELDPERRRIELREIRFSSRGGRKEVHVGKSTPPKCLQCHGANPRPIWAMYSTWPGVYGSKNDLFADGTNEDEDYVRFLDSVRANPRSRYGKLEFRTDTEVPPYNRQQKTDEYRFRPNLLLTKVLMRFNAVRLVGLVRESPYFEAYRWVLPLALEEQGCRLTRDMRDRLEVHLKTLAAAEKRKLVEWKGYWIHLLELLGATVERFNMDPASGGYAYPDGTGGQTSYFADALLLSLAQESPEVAAVLAPDKTAHRDRYENSPFYRLIDELIPRLHISKLNFTPSTMKNPFGRVKDCGPLLKLAKAQLDREPVAAKRAANEETFGSRLRRAEERRPNPAVPVSCVYCHMTNGKAPEIPFDDEKALARELTAEGGRLLKEIRDRLAPQAPKHQVMPPANQDEFAPLTGDEVKAFDAYLRGLLN